MKDTTDYLARIATRTTLKKLRVLTEQGMHQFAGERFDLCARDHNWRCATNTVSCLYPRPAEPISCAQHTQPRRHVYQEDETSIFRFTSLEEMLRIFFTEDAIRFLITHSYNGFLFWQSIGTMLYSGSDMPYTAELLTQYLVQERSPMQMAEQMTAGEEALDRLRCAAQKNGGSFAPNNLDAELATELLLSGFLLRLRTGIPEKTAGLVVNPMWEFLLERVNLRTDHQPEQDGTIVLRHMASGERHVLIQPLKGYNAGEIAQGLAEGRYRLHNHEITEKPTDPSATSVRIVARVLEARRSEPIVHAWNVETGRYDRAIHGWIKRLPI